MTEVVPSPAAMVSVSEEVPSPVATVRARRSNRTPFPSSMQVGANEASSDEDWDEEDEADASENAEAGGVSNVGRGRVRLHAAQPQSASALDDEDERRKCLADKGWARRSTVIRGISGSGKNTPFSH